MARVKPRRDARRKPKPARDARTGRPLPPCERCLKLALDERIHEQAVMPIPPGAEAALARDGSGRCCRDCESADTLVALGILPEFVMARVATANERMEQLRLPELARPHFGLAQRKLLKLSEGPDALERHLRWLDQVLPGWFTDEGPQMGTEDERGRVYHLPDPHVVEGVEDSD